MTQGAGGMGEKGERINTNETSYRDVKYSTRNIANNIVIVMDGARVLEISEEHFVKYYMIV